MRTGNNDMRAGRRYSNMDKMNHIVPVHLLINIELLSTSVAHLGFMVFLKDIIYLE